MEPLAGYDAVGGLIGNQGAIDTFDNIVLSFVGPRHGVLAWSSWIAVCLVAWRGIRKTHPSWVFGVPFVAGVYIVAHAALEIASGGLPFGYRYQLEAVTLAAPFLLLALPKILKSKYLRIAMAVTGGASVFFQLAFVFLSKCFAGGPTGFTCSLFG